MGRARDTRRGMDFKGSPSGGWPNPETGCKTCTCKYSFSFH